MLASAPLNVLFVSPVPTPPYKAIALIVAESLYPALVDRQISSQNFLPPLIVFSSLSVAPKQDVKH